MPTLLCELPAQESIRSLSVIHISCVYWRNTLEYVRNHLYSCLTVCVESVCNHLYRCLTVRVLNTFTLYVIICTAV